MTRPWKIAILGAVAVIVAAVLGAVLPIVLTGGEEPTIEVEFVGVQEVAPGQTVNIVGKNLDLVAAVFLRKQIETSFRIPFIRPNDMKLILTIPDEVRPGKYLLEFETSEAQIVETGRTVNVVSPVPLTAVATDTPVPTPEPTFEPSPEPTPEPTLEPTLEATSEPTLEPTPEPPFTVTITQPLDGVEVPSQVTVEGTTNHSIPEGHTLWVVIQIDGKWYPSEAPVAPLPRQGRTELEWQVTLFTGQAGDQGDILAVLTTPDIDQKLASGGEILGAELLGKGAEVKARVAVERGPDPTPADTPTPTPTPLPTNTPTPLPPPPFAVEITQPLDGDQVPISISVRGTTTGPVPQGRSLWIVVGIGGRWWPQTAPVNPFPGAGTTDYDWIISAFVGQQNDQGKSFEILAILTTPSIDQTFEEWFSTGERTGSYPGFVPGVLIGDGTEIRGGITVTRS